MSRDRELCKKDKRLLVLLTLGAIMLLLHQNYTRLPELKISQPVWLEMHTDDVTLYRCDQIFPESIQGEKIQRSVLPDDHGVQETLAAKLTSSSAVAVENSNGTVHFPSLSPRLSFFLGQGMPVNAAESAELVLIPGIGPGLAENIVQYRRQKGRINNRLDLVAVSGIGRQRAEKLTPYITFE